MSAPAAFVVGAIAGAAVAGWTARAYARRRAEMFGRLFSFAMHELNTPVTAVNMTVLNLLSEVFGPLPAPLKPWVEMTREQVGRLNGLVGEVRDFVHMELHRDLRVASQPAAAQEIVDDALVGIRRGMEQSQVEFVLKVEQGLPALRTDSERAARCVTSMLFHARKFRVSGPIRLVVSKGAAGVDFEVDYTGPKMTAEEAAECLDLYYPAKHRHDQVLAAIGLGLGLLRSVARLIGGDLDFRVAESGRSAITLRLPVDGGS